MDLEAGIFALMKLYASLVSSKIKKNLVFIINSVGVQ
jgi:hypothetical protein